MKEVMNLKPNYRRRIEAHLDIHFQKGPVQATAKQKHSHSLQRIWVRRASLQIHRRHKDLLKNMIRKTKAGQMSTEIVMNRSQSISIPTLVISVRSCLRITSRAYFMTRRSWSQTWLIFREWTYVRWHWPQAMSHLWRKHSTRSAPGNTETLITSIS